ncbi:DUF4124 domain-containing protein [Marinobacteraceae bacterium S3BR75-40.1]
MLKWTLRLLIPALLILALALPFWLKKPNGEPVAELPSFESLVPAPVTDSGPDVFYKWQDAQGSWHYSDTPPENIQADAITVDPNTNLVPGHPVAAEEGTGNEVPAPLSAGEEPATELMPTPDRVKKLIEDAKQARDTLEQRYQDRERQLESL